MAIPTKHTNSLLLIENSSILTTQFQVHFRNLGYNVQTAKNGLEGLSLLRQAVSTGKSPDLIIINFLLPQPDGPAVCRELKADKQLQALPVLIFSEEDKMAYMTQAFKAGAEYYVVLGSDGLQTLELRTQAILMRQLRRNNPG